MKHILVSMMLASQPELVCADTHQFVKHLDQHYGERIVGSGIRTDGSVLTVYASRDGNWSVLETLVGGLQATVSCIVAAGDGWIAHE